MPKWEERKNGVGKKIFKEIMAVNLPNFLKNIYLYIQEDKLILPWLNPKRLRSTLRHHHRENTESQREKEERRKRKWFNVYKKPSIRNKQMPGDSGVTQSKARKGRKKLPTKKLLSSKTIFQMVRWDMTFQDKQKQYSLLVDMP